MYNPDINGYIKLYFDSDVWNIDGKNYEMCLVLNPEQTRIIRKFEILNALVDVSNLIVEVEGKMVYGRKLGLWKYYHRNGLIKLEAEYSLNDKNFGEVPAGTPDSAAYLCWNTTFKDGIWKQYDEEGSLIKDLRYKNNVLLK